MAEKSTQTEEMKTLGNLHPARGSNTRIKRIGRGIGSGLGKTAGKGHKGQWARKGGGVRPGFEGGQKPLYMRLPKRGFNSPNRILFNVINLDQLATLDGAVTTESLKKAGFLRNAAWPVKLLGRGTLSKKLQITVHKASESAKAAVEKAGGTLTVLGIAEPAKPVRHKHKEAKAALAAKIAAKNAARKKKS